MDTVGSYLSQPRDVKGHEGIRRERGVLRVRGKARPHWPPHPLPCWPGGITTFDLFQWLPRCFCMYRYIDWCRRAWR